MSKATEKEFSKDKEWSTIHQDRYVWLYNYICTLYPDAVHLSYIEKYKRQLISIILNNKNWGNSSKEGLLFMVARYLYIIKDRYSKTFSDAGFVLLKEAQEKEGNNELDDKEKIHFRPHEYFVSLLENIDQSTILTKDQHLKYLLLNILVYQPPLRTSFYTSAKIIRSKSEDNGKDNYVLINRRGKVKISFIVNKDKASNYKIYNMNPKFKVIELSDDKLEKLINESFIKYPRDNLFEHTGKTQISQTTFLRWLREISNVSGLTVDIMRSSFITWYYSKNLNFGARDKLSKVMRHSVNTASRNYNKVFDVDDNPTLNSDYNKVNVALELKIKELQDKLNAYSTVKNEDTKNYNKRKRDIIYLLNNGKESKQSTMDKYEIKFNDDLKKYY